MILVLGADNYLGRIFCRELHRRGRDFLLPARKDYSEFDALFDCIRRTKPEFIINAAGCCAGADLDDCEISREETLHANTILPLAIAKVCLVTNTPWGHISSCAVYTGAKIMSDDGLVIEKKFSHDELLRLLAECPEKIHGYTESDEPNFSFRNVPCNFFSGTAALAEEAICGLGSNYIWRTGIPFNGFDEPENYLRQLLNSDKVYNSVSALSHTEDFVRACLDLQELRAPFGIYNVANPGVITTAQVVQMLQKHLGIPRLFEFWKESEFNRTGSRALRANYVVDTSKLLAAGANMRPVMEALEDSIRNWRGTFGEELHKVAA
ncbi:MAG TPA: sugar nucleotide-binding protein [Verrucomicrobiae bacterium]|jgi:dTDP-4-dehydrorhamnose reductase